MPEARLIRQCAPTLAGLKSGSLFLYPCTFGPALRATLRRWNRQFMSGGLCILPIRTDQKGALLYLYRPGLLSADLAVPAAVQVLSQCGYPAGDPTRCITRLIRRLRTSQDFPHEIGLFLGYPPEDVLGFIENKAQDYKLSGLWKVYGDEEKARKRFDLFKKCDRVYYKRWSQGTNIERLTVAA